MANAKLDPNSQNNEIGIFFRKSRKVTIGTQFGELASFIKAKQEGDVVWKNNITGEVNVWNFEAGETYPLVCDEILVSATIDSVLYTTAPTDLFWASTPANVGAQER
jgi:hypothetical protein